MDIFHDGFYKRNRILMLLIGIWPESSSSFNRILRITLLITLISIMIPQFAFLVRMRNSADEFLAAVTAQIIIANATIKYLFMASNMNKIQNMMDLMREDWNVLKEIDALEKIQNYTNRGCLATKIYMTAQFAAGAFFLLSPVQIVILDTIIPLNESREKLFAFSTDYDVYGIDDNKHYFLVIIHGFITGMMVVNGLVAVDCFVLISVEHCCGLFETVGDIMQRIEFQYSSEEQYRTICIAVTVHHRAINLADSIELSFSMMNGLVVFVTMLGISVTGVAATMRLDQPAELARFGFFGIAQMLHLLFISLPGQEMIDYSSRVSEKLYASRWPNVSIRDKKLICIMLMRSMKPICLTAGGFYLMNLENFGNVLKTSLSYFTMILSTQ